jgi:hypothetical protein
VSHLSRGRGPSHGPSHSPLSLQGVRQGLKIPFFIRAPISAHIQSVVCARRVSDALAQFFSKRVRLLFLPSVQISLSFWPHSLCRYRNESRFVIHLLLRRGFSTFTLVVVGTISTLLFTLLVFLSSFITTYFMSAFDDDGQSSTYFYSSYWISPYEVTQDLVRAALRIIKDESGIIDGSVLSTATGSPRPIIIGPEPAPASPGYLRTFLTRILLGLPVVGAGSLVQLLMSMPMLGPVQWLARYRGSRRRENSRDMAAFVLVILLVVGAIRSAYWSISHHSLS